MNLLENLKVEVYHCSADDEDAENILIGEGELNLHPADLKSTPKIIKVILHSTMTSRNKAALNLKVAVG